MQRFANIWFSQLTTDWFVRRNPTLKDIPFVLTIMVHGRMVITAANNIATANGITTGMVLADARAIVPALQRFDDSPGLPEKLLNALGAWCLQYTPVITVAPPDSLILDISGCPHLWGGETPYLQDIISRISQLGYQVNASIADTIGAAWAITHFGPPAAIIPPGEQKAALLPLPPAALRLEQPVLERLAKLGLHRIGNIIHMQRPALRRRFGNELLLRLDQALGMEQELTVPLQPVQPFQERLPCLEPIVTRTGIEIALQQLLQALCTRLQQQGKGLRNAIFSCFRIDGKTIQVSIATNRASHHAAHIFKLFDLKLSVIEPALGIETFLLEATNVEDAIPEQETIWHPTNGLEDESLAALLDRLTAKIGPGIVNRYLPAEHHWPERAVRPVSSLQEKPATSWRTDRPRPICLLPAPEPVQVTAPIPDYPPIQFLYKNVLHKVVKADGPERIEREWWLDGGQHRDYYIVEDEQGCRYWIFRLGHYNAERTYGWFIHGFFP